MNHINSPVQDNSFTPHQDHLRRDIFEPENPIPPSLIHFDKVDESVNINIEEN
jgi:hypothetical protein